MLRLPKISGSSIYIVLFMIAIFSGTEFFTEFRSKHMCADEMFFDWDQAFVNAQLKLPNINLVNEIPLNWDFYKVLHVFFPL